MAHGRHRQPRARSSRGGREPHGADLGQCPERLRPEQSGALRSRGTASQTLWERYRRFHGSAKLVAIDVAPNTSLQLRNSAEVLNVGGFSDAVFDVVAAFLRGDASGASLVAAVSAVEL